MNKFLLGLAAGLCTGFVFTSCDKDDNRPANSRISEINATVEKGNDYNSDIDVVKAMIWAEDKSISYDSESYHEVASANYSKGGFTLDLSKTVDTQYLELFATDDMPDGITISDSTAKGTSMDILAFKSGVEVGDFSYISQDSTVLGVFFYVDKNVLITGSFIEEEINYSNNFKYDLTLKKGWNIMYLRDSETDSSYTIEATTKAQSGMKWYYNEDNSYSQASANKSIGIRKPFSLFK